MKATIIKKKRNTKKYAKVFKSLYVLMLMISITSCNGDDAPKDDNTRLKAYTIGSSTYNVNYNDLGMITRNGPESIIYDAEGRIIQIGETSYTYNNQSRVSKRVQRINNGGRITKIENSYVYNNQGLIAYLKYIYEVNGYIAEEFSRSYTYDSKNKLVNIISRELELNYKKLSFTYDANDNIVQLYTEESYDGGVTYFESTNNTYTYDNKKKPLELATKIGNINIIELPIYYFKNINVDAAAAYHISKNNMLSSQVIQGDRTFTEVFEYTYNENNYPISAESKYTSSKDNYSSTTSRTWTYEDY